MTVARPHVRKAFRPCTLLELEHAFLDATWVRDDITTGEGEHAFCSGGDQSVRGSGGFVGTDSVPRIAVLDLHIMMRRVCKPVIAIEDCSDAITSKDEDLRHSPQTAPCPCRPKLSPTRTRPRSPTWGLPSPFSPPTQLLLPRPRPVRLNLPRLRSWWRQ